MKNLRKIYPGNSCRFYVIRCGPLFIRPLLHKTCPRGSIILAPSNEPCGLLIHTAGAKQALINQSEGNVFSNSQRKEPGNHQSVSWLA